MTTLEEDVSVEVEAPDTEDAPKAKKGRKRDLDFTKFSEANRELADYVNAHSGLDPLTGNQVKALLALKQDWADTDEQKAKRQAAADARAAAKAKYAGLSDEQIKVEKAAEKAEAQAEKLRQRVQEAMDRAKAIREGKSATGEDIAAAVEAEQSPSFSDTPVEPEAKRGRFGRNR